MLTKEQILSITDNAVKEIQVPEWGGTVYVRAMSVEDVEFMRTADAENDPAAIIRGVIRFICNPDGSLLFTEDDIPALKKKQISVWKGILEKINNFSSVDDAEKNSESTPA